MPTRYRSFIPEIARRVANAADASVNDVAVLVRDEARRQAQMQIYATPPSRNYQRTGNLKRGINILGRGRRRTVVSSAVRGYGGNKVNYAMYVHEGTRYQAPRPYLADAMRWARQRVRTVAMKRFSAVGPRSNWRGVNAGGSMSGTVGEDVG